MHKLTWQAFTNNYNECGCRFYTHIFYIFFVSFFMCLQAVDALAPSRRRAIINCMGYFQMCKHILLYAYRADLGLIFIAISARCRVDYVPVSLTGMCMIPELDAATISPRHPLSFEEAEIKPVFLPPCIIHIFQTTKYLSIQHIYFSVL